MTQNIERALAKSDLIKALFRNICDKTRRHKIRQSNLFYLSIEMSLRKAHKEDSHTLNVTKVFITVITI